MERKESILSRERLSAYISKKEQQRLLTLEQEGKEHVFAKERLSLIQADIEDKAQRQRSNVALTKVQL